MFRQPGGRDFWATVRHNARVSRLALSGRRIDDPVLAADVKRVVLEAVRPGPIRRIRSRRVRKLALIGGYVVAGVVIWAIGLLLGGWAHGRWVLVIVWATLAALLNSGPFRRYLKTARANDWTGPAGTRA